MPQCANYRLKTKQRDAYTHEPELGNMLGFRPYKHQIAVINERVENTDAKVSEVLRDLIQKGIDNGKEQTVEALLEDVYAAAPDKETREAVCLLEDKLARGEVEL